MSDAKQVHPFVRLARHAVEQNLHGAGTYINGTDIDPDESLWEAKKACFVSIKGPDGSLRGCIGTILPIRPTLDREIALNAVSSACDDPRFPPLTEEDLASVSFSVDVLSQPELVTDRASLDPKKYGIIVSRGMRQGVLLPDLPGIDSVDEQIRIALRKASIGANDKYEIERFTVERYSE